MTKPLTIDEIKREPLPEEEIDFILAVISRLPQVTVHRGENGKLFLKGIALKETRPVRGPQRRVE